ncbi:hypothetical protein KMI_24g20140 [Encephalitozoon hellem]|nr:hypothetical protein KMI_24g20140 [Encephalitozoon hellem]
MCCGEQMVMGQAYGGMGTLESGGWFGRGFCLDSVACVLMLGDVGRMETIGSVVWDQGSGMWSQRVWESLCLGLWGTKVLGVLCGGGMCVWM